MHELSLAQSIVDIVTAQAQRERFQRVERVRVEVGALAHVEPEALAFGFVSVSRGSVAEGAALDLVHVPGRAACVACGATVEIARRGEPCPACGSFDLLVAGGEELRVVELEVL